MRQIALALTFCVYCFSSSIAQHFSIVKDINNSKSGMPSCFYVDSLGKIQQGFLVLNNVAYFLANDGSHGNELWRSDGTNKGTFMVKDINPGSKSGNIGTLTLFNGKIYFSASNNDNNNELWRSDGTDTGTVMVKDIYPGVKGSNPGNIIATKKWLFFIATDSLHGGELWKSNGTENGTTLMKDLLPGFSGSNISDLKPVNGNVCFFINPNYSGSQLWKTDGSTNGTDSIMSIAAPMPREIVSTGKKLFFADYSGNLWVSDGTRINTGLLKQMFLPGLNFDNLVAVGSKVFFTAYNEPGGEELWISDGTSAGTVLVKDITPTPDSMSSILNKTAVGNKLFFWGANANRNYDLWKSDGTANGTVIVKSIPSITSPAGSIFNINNNIYLSVYTDNEGFELWKSNGTSTGTTMIKDVYSGTKSSSPGFITGLNGKILFSADNKGNGIELWQSDGTATGTALLKNINTISSESAYPYALTVFKDELYFGAQDDENAGYQLWKTNGTETGTKLVKSIQQSVYNYDKYFISSFATTANAIYFPSFDYGHGKELWKSDGNPSGTNLVKDITSGKSGTGRLFWGPNYYTAVNDKLFFLSGARTEYSYDNESFTGSTAWVTDGTVAGTKSIYSTGSLNNMLRAGNFVFFNEYLSSNAVLWKTDGFSTTKIPKASIALYSSAMADSLLYYFQSTDNSLWRTDGSESGTFHIANVSLSFYDQTIGTAVVNDKLFFSATEQTHGNELWTTNGTSRGTVLVKDINSGSGSSNLNYLTKLGDLLYFVADDGIHGSELWKSNGTKKGTTLVKDITPGSNSSLISNLIAVGGKLCFKVYNSAVNTFSLWESDGTKAGTKPVEDSGLYNINISGKMLAIGNRVYFSATTNNEGEEIWSGDIEQNLKKNISSSASVKTENNSCAIIPNPFKQSARLIINSSNRQTCYIYLADISGKNIMERKYNLDKGNNFITYNTSYMASGVYFFKVKFSDNTLKIIKAIKQ